METDFARKKLTGGWCSPRVRRSRVRELFRSITRSFHILQENASVDVSILTGNFKPNEGDRRAHLSPDLEHVLETDRCIRQLGLQHGHNVLVVLAHLLAPRSRVEIRLREALQLGNLLVESSDVLFDDIGEFLLASSPSDARGRSSVPLSHSSCEEGDLEDSR